jgi:hypothetical protein
VILPQTLVRRWRKEGITLLPAESAQAIAEAFAGVGSIATPDVLEFYSEFGGMEPMDDGFLKIWSLSEIVAENAERSGFGPLFADYLISSWSFRLKPVGAERSAVYVDHHSGTKPPELVANSLAEFLAIYERDPEAAHAW